MVFRLVNKKIENMTNGVVTTMLDTLKNALTQSFIITVMNGDGKIVEINENFLKTFKYSLSELYMQDYWILNSGYHSEEFANGIWSTVQMGDQWSGELCHRAKNGELVWVKSTIIPIQNKGESPLQVIVISTNITNQKELERWKYLACHQELTTLPNRRMLDYSIGSFVLRAKQKQEKIAILYMDINHFKSINDTYGHLVGDLILKEVGDRLSSLHTLKQCIFHLSGDEFIIIIEDVKNIGVYTNLINELFNKQFLIGNHLIHASVSIGMSIYPDHSKDIKTLIKYADLAMYGAKGQPGNGFLEYESSLNNPSYDY